MRIGTWFGLAAVLSLGLAGCATLPAQGPSTDQVLSEAKPSDGALPRYLVAELTPQAIAVLDSYPRPSLVNRFGTGGPAPSVVIGTGDAVQITIWEAASGGLFSSASIDGITAGSHSASIPQQIVSRDGTITVPYAGTLQVRGRTPHQVEAMIVERLASKAIEPQALVSIVHNESSTATVLGEVTTGARVPLSIRGDRVLDAIAAAGGNKAPVQEVFISLSRGNVTARVPMQALVVHPQENIYLHAGDILTVEREPQTFTAFGATGHNAIVPFDAIGLTLEEAVAKAGGLLSFISDPQGVFLLRAEPVEIARRLDPSYPIPPGARAVNVVYRINLKDANSYFVARHFAMRNKDIMYVASSPSTEFLKALQLFGAATSPVITGASLGGI